MCEEEREAWITSLQAFFSPHVVIIMFARLN